MDAIVKLLETLKGYVEKILEFFNNLLAEMTKSGDAEVEDTTAEA